MTTCDGSPGRQGQHPREPAPTGSHHKRREQQGRHARSDLVGVDAAQDDFIVAIPGSRKLERIQEDLGTADFDLTDDEFAQIEEELAKMVIHENRTEEDIAKLGETT